MTVHIIAEFRSLPGQEDRLRTALEAMIEPSLAEPGCLSYHPYTDPNDPSHMVLLEEWTDPEAIDRHFATPHFDHVKDVLDRILVEPFAIRRLIAV